MCHIRGYHYTCNHTAYRYVSMCRGTYATRSSPSTPLCLAAEIPSVILSLNEMCLSCGFDAFITEWEDRIRKVEVKRDMIQACLSRSTAADELGWGCVPTWGCGGGVWDHNFPDFNNDAEFSLNGGDNEDGDRLSPSDETSLKFQFAEVSAEVNELYLKFGQEKWANWHSYLNNSCWDIEKRRPGHWRRRKSSPKMKGGSNLNYVVNSTDLPEPDNTSDNERSLIGRLDSFRSTSGESDCSESPSLSTCSSLSNDIAEIAWNDEELPSISELNEEDSLLEQGEKSPVVAIFEVKKLGDKRGLFWRQGTVQLDTLEDENDLLPNWLDFPKQTR